MSGFFEKAKEKALIASQFLKEKAGTTQTEVDPEYQTAIEQFKIIKNRLKQFIEDVNEILDCIQPICETGRNFASSLKIAEDRIGSDNTLSNSFDKFFYRLNELAKGNLIALSKPAVLDYLKTLKSQFDELETIQNERRNIQLLCDSYRDALDKISKSGKPDDVAKKRILYESKMQTLKEYTDRFKREMSILWEQRFKILEVPLQQLIGIVYLFCQESFGYLKELQTTVTLEELSQQYPPSNHSSPFEPKL